MNILPAVGKMFTPRNPSMATHPEVREDIIRYMSGSMEVYLQELTKRYFKRPSDSDARQMTLEALAIALTKLTAGDKNARGMLQTFATELLDQQEKSR